MSMQITILGCGSSAGVPAIGNYWGNCNPKNPKNRRLRCSILIKSDKSQILIDASPDLRQQLLSANVTDIDGVLITHAHADHIHGIDDFRYLNHIMNKHINLYAKSAVIDEIRKKFNYVFDDLVPESNGFYYKPCLIPNEISGQFKIKDLKIKSFQQNHGFGETTGFRINNIAYSTDVVELNEKAFSNLHDLDLWIVDCLRFKPHKTHSHFEKTMEWINRIKPKKTILTHMNFEVDYDEITKKLPKNCYAGFDGLTIKV